MGSWSEPWRRQLRTWAVLALSWKHPKESNAEWHTRCLSARQRLPGFRRRLRLHSRGLTQQKGMQLLWVLRLN